MHICTVIKDTVQSLETERNEYVFKRDLDDDSDGAHLNIAILNLRHITKELQEETSSSFFDIFCMINNCAY